MRSRITLLFILLLAALFSLALAQDYPLSLTDSLGREVRLRAEPSRVVSMLPSHSEVVCAIGACDKLVGVDDFSDYPPELQELPRLGSGLVGSNVEAIIALEPDLVLVSPYGELAGVLAQAGLTVYAGAAETYEEALEEFVTLGRLLNRELEAARLAGRVEGEVAALAWVAEGLDAPTFYYEIDPTPYSIGPGSFLGRLLSLAGGRNIVPAEMGDFPQLDPEFVVAANPEVIFLSPYAPADLASRTGWEDLTAVQEERVVVLSEEEANFVSRPGPRMGQAVRLFLRLLHPGRF